MHRKLFVYGTLRTDIPGGNRLLGDRIGLHAHVQGVVLLHFGPYPGMHVVDDDSMHVKGRLYDFTSLTSEEWEALLAQLDAYEREGQLFDRIKAHANLLDGSSEPCQTYVIREEYAPKALGIITSGDWKEAINHA